MTLATYIHSIANSYTTQLRILDDCRKKTTMLSKYNNIEMMFLKIKVCVVELNAFCLLELFYFLFPQ